MSPKPDAGGFCSCGEPWWLRIDAKGLLQLTGMTLLDYVLDPFTANVAQLRASCDRCSTESLFAFGVTTQAQG